MTAVSCFGDGDLERDFTTGSEDCSWSLRGNESDLRFTRDLDIERDLDRCLAGDRDLNKNKQFVKIGQQRVELEQ